MSWEDDSPLKRFAHKSQGGRRQKGQHGRKGNAADFKPQNMIGKYAVKSHFFRKISTNNGKDSMWLEIHQLVASDTAYSATFDFGAVEGVMIIAGSRKSLREAVDDVEDRQGEEEAENKEEEHSVTASSDSEREMGTRSEEVEGRPDFVLPSHLNRPKHAFEKNTFKTPKWFARWRGRVEEEALKSAADQKGSIQEAASHNAHIEFTTAACENFSGTFTCAQLGAKDIAFEGHKVTSRPSIARNTWNDFA